MARLLHLAWRRDHIVRGVGLEFEDARGAAQGGCVALFGGLAWGGEQRKRLWHLAPRGVVRIASTSAKDRLTGVFLGVLW